MGTNERKTHRQTHLHVVDQVVVNLGEVGAAVQEDACGLCAAPVDNVVIDLDVGATLGGDDTCRWSNATASWGGVEIGAWWLQCSREW